MMNAKRTLNAKAKMVTEPRPGVIRLTARVDKTISTSLLTYSGEGRDSVQIPKNFFPKNFSSNIHFAAIEKRRTSLYY